MDDLNDDFLEEIRQDFLIEAAEMISKAETCFMDYENDTANASTIATILRLFHSIKGSSSAVGYDGLSAFAHLAEDLIIAARDEKVLINSHLTDILLQSSDVIALGINAIKNSEDDLHFYIECGEKIKIHLAAGVSSPAEIDENKQAAPVEKKTEVQVMVASQNTVEDNSKGHLKFSNQQKDPPSGKEKDKSSQSNLKEEKDEGIKVSLAKIDTILDSFGEQVIMQKRLGHLIRHGIEENKDEINKLTRMIDKNTNDLQQTVVTLRMVNLSTTFKRMQRVIRESAKLIGKKIEFIKVGENSELDKNIADALVDPLTHMVRNSVDHGLEMPQDRIAAGKDEVGKVELHAYRRGGYFYIQVKDDGKGLNKEMIVNKAIEKGLISRKDNLSDREIYNLIFMNGFSTKEVTTSLSGRGVGMDVVKQMISNLKGTCEIDSEIGRGTTFTIRLPLTLAMFQGIVVRLDQQNFIIPSSDFKETGNVDLSRLKKTTTGKMVIDYKNKILPAISLNNKFQITRTQSNQQTKDCLGAIIPYENQEYLVLFDDLISQERIVFKKLLPNVENIPGISGGAILGDGKVVLILEMNEIVSNYKTAS